MAGTFTPIDGDTLDDIIEENGGVGDWEGAAAPHEAVERWQFPRFHGADDPGDLYLSRTGIGPDNDTDVETLVSWLQAPRNRIGAVLLLSEPGTGKTALIEAAVTHMYDSALGEDGTPHLLTILCTPDHTRDSLFLKYVGDGHGEGGTPFALGPIPYAAKYGKKLYCDETMMLTDGVKPVLYALSDGRKYLPEGNVDGSPLEIHDDFRLILSSNPMVRGASLPEPLASRCASTTLTVETTGDLLRDLNVDESVVAAWEALKSGGLWYPQIREVMVADYWLAVDPTQAASAFLPEHCPESQREAVKNMVTSFIGGDLRKDGRLVVR